jgi:leucyl aminopeptidase (aminopeptidase T)
MSLLDLIKIKQRETSEWDEATHEKQVDWTHFLAPEALATLRKVLESAYNHREAYFRATDIKNAQLWSALLEMQKQIDELNEKVRKLTPQETVRKFQYGTPQESVVLDRIRQIMQKGPEDSKAARNALIDSLLRF